MSNKPIIQFVNRRIYKITPKNKSQPAFVAQWIGFNRTINFNNKDEIVGVKTLVKYQFISDAKCHGNPLQGNDHNMEVSLNNISKVEETNLVIGESYQVGERTLVLRGFLKDTFYVSEDPRTNDYHIYHNVPIDEKRQIFRIPMTDL